MSATNLAAQPSSAAAGEPSVPPPASQSSFPSYHSSQQQQSQQQPPSAFHPLHHASSRPSSLRSKPSSLTSRDGTPFLTSTQILQARAALPSDRGQQQQPPRGTEDPSLDSNTARGARSQSSSKDSFARRLGLAVRRPSAFASNRQSLATSNDSTSFNTTLGSSSYSTREGSDAPSLSTPNSTRALPATLPDQSSKDPYKRAWPSTSGDQPHSRPGAVGSTGRGSSFRSIKKFFQSKSSREKEELAIDRTRRRRSYVELGTPREEINDATPRAEQAPHWSDRSSSSHRRGLGVLPRSLRTAASSSQATSSLAARSNGSLDRIHNALFPATRESQDSSATRSDSVRTSSSLRQAFHHPPPIPASSAGGDYFSYQGPKTATPSNTSVKAHPADSSVESFGSFGSGSASGTAIPPPASHHRLKTSASHPSLPTVIASPRDTTTPGQSPAAALAASALATSSQSNGQGPIRPLGTPQATRSESELEDKAKENTESQEQIGHEQMLKNAQVGNWRLPSFGRKSSSGGGGKKEEPWGDHERGTGSFSPMGTSRSGDSNKPRQSSAGDSPSSLRKSSIVDDLRDTGYLPRSSSIAMRRDPSGQGSRSASSSKIERLMGAGADAAALASAQTLGRSESQRSFDHRASTSTPSSLHEVPATNQNSGSDSRNDADCPICLERLSYRLSGEKPHVVPNCGHALHNACFTAVYGQPEAILAAQDGGPSGKQGGPPGMCGVCRKAIVLGGDVGENSRSAKLTGMIGLGDPRSKLFQVNNRDESVAGDDPIGNLAAGRKFNDQLSAHRTVMSSPASRSTVLEANGHYDAFGTPSPPAASQLSVHPMIRLRPEFNTIYRKDPTGENGKQNMVCVVSVEVPSRRPTLTLEEEEAKHQMHWRGLPKDVGDDGNLTATDEENADGTTDNDDTEDEHQAEASYSPRASGMPDSLSSGNSLAAASSDIDQDQKDRSDDTTEDDKGENHKETRNGDEEGFSLHATPAGEGISYHAVFEDLKIRIADWKGQPIEKFGQLSLYDYIGISQDNVVRNFWVYLFSSALICVTESRQADRGLSRISGSHSDKRKPGAKPRLKLKGRIWLRHISEMTETTVQATPSLGITLDDDTLGNFVLVFPTSTARQAWREKLETLADEAKRTYALRHPTPAASIASSVTTTANGTSIGRAAASLKELPSVKAALDPSSYEQGAPTPSTPAKSAPTDLGPRSARSASLISGKSGSDPSSARMSTAATTPAASPAKVTGVKQLKKKGSNGAIAQRGSYNPVLPTQQKWSASGGLDPSLSPPELLPHAPIDLILMVSVPLVIQSETAGVSSSAALKLRLIRSTLEFVSTHLGPSDRLAVVTYSSGTDGDVRKTGLLSVTARDRSRAKLRDFIESIGKAWDAGEEDPYRVDAEALGGASERTDTVTALNVGLDIVLSRKVKNAMTGMILINDTSDGPARRQMDLVMTRAEAAHTPIHCFGFGKSSNPSSLWLISNHTRGSYTFVKEWYQLRECIAGCIGSLMSTAVDQFKLRISVPSDNHFKVKKVQGVLNAVVSSSGKHVDIEVGELRYGEARELLIELELDFNGLVPFIAQMNSDGRVGVKKVQNAPAIEAGSATDDFIQRLGLSDLSIADDAVGGSDLYGVDQPMDSLIEEVAVFEVDAGYRDVMTGASQHRMSQPSVLTLEVDASTPEAGSSHPQQTSDAIVTRRRIELLVSDMITRSLLLVSRKNYGQALRIINETHKIVETVLRKLTDGNGGGPEGGRVAGALSRRTSVNSNLFSNSSSPISIRGFKAVSGRSTAARQRALVQNQAVVSLLAILDDLELTALHLQSPSARGHFERDGRNAAAQQAMVLRDQQAWTTRTITEALRFLADNGPAFAAVAYATSRS